MGENHNNPIFKYLLLLCLSITLLLAQTDKLHMHFEHDDHSGSAAHVIGVHSESTLHDFDLTNHHDDHSTVAVDMSPDTLLKNTGLLNPLVIILLVLGFFLCISRRTRVSRQKIYKILFPPCYYLFQPPLRAPPVK